MRPLVLFPLGLALLLSSPWPALFLALDFSLRVSGRRRWSPVASLAWWLVAVAGLAPRPTNGGPRAFAAKPGFGFSLAVAASFLLGDTTAELVAGVPFSVCADFTRRVPMRLRKPRVRRLGAAPARIPPAWRPWS